MVTAILTATETPDREVFLSETAQLSPAGSQKFVYDATEWVARRDGGLAPRYAGPLGSMHDQRQHLVLGADHAGLGWDDLKPQQLRIIDAICTPGITNFVVEAPRRSSKSSSIFMYLHGLALAEPGTRIAFIAGESGTVARRLFRQWVDKINQHVPPGPGEDPKKRSFFEEPRRRKPTFGRLAFDLDLPETATSSTLGLPRADLRDQWGRRGFVTMVGAGAEQIVYANGSRLIVLKPDAESIIGQEFDVIWIDEAQSLDPEIGADLIDRAAPTLDTRPWPRFILSGTTGSRRFGPFWDRLKRLRDGDPTIGGLDWAVDPLTAVEDIEDETTALTLLQGMHPGIGTLTTLDRMRERYRDATDRPRWAREYLSLWPETSSETIITAQAWEPLGLAAPPRRPALGHAAIGVKIAHGGGTAAVVIAWRSTTGHAHIQVVAHRLGTKWLPEFIANLATKHRAPVGFDGTPDAIATIAELSRVAKAIDISRLTWQDMNAGAVQLAREIDRGTLRHQQQAELTTAALAATRRPVGRQHEGWLFDWPNDIDGTPLDAAVVALRIFDKKLGARIARAASTRPGVIILAGASKQ